jgi:hypothetical protein
LIKAFWLEKMFYQGSALLAQIAFFKTFVRATVFDTIATTRRGWNRASQAKCEPKGNKTLARSGAQTEHNSNDTVLIALHRWEAYSTSVLHAQ